MFTLFTIIPCFWYGVLNIAGAQKLFFESQMSVPIHVSPWISHNSLHVPYTLLMKSHLVIPLWVSPAPLLRITSQPSHSYSFLKDAAIVFYNFVSWEQVSSLPNCELWEQKLSMQELKMGGVVGSWVMRLTMHHKGTLQIRMSYVSSYMLEVRGFGDWLRTQYQQSGKASWGRRVYMDFWSMGKNGIGLEGEEREYLIGEEALKMPIDEVKGEPCWTY